MRRALAAWLTSLPVQSILDIFQSVTDDNYRHTRLYSGLGLEIPRSCTFVGQHRLGVLAHGN